MLFSGEYNRERALAYAERWAFARNPLFVNYSGLGGDCTNFVSQCLYAGCCVMNYTPVYGWYYISDSDRTASWTGVQFFYNFITQNQSSGVFGANSDGKDLMPGDVIQLGNEEGVFYHTLLVTGAASGDYLVAAHSDDAFDRPLSTYDFDRARYIRVLGAKIEIPIGDDCFQKLLNGEEI